MTTELMTVQWGLLGVFGVVIGLLLPAADRHFQNFKATGSDADHDLARRWSVSIKLTAWLVLLSLLLLLPVFHFLFSRLETSTFLTWLLLMPVFAQVGLVILSHALVKNVPAVVLLSLEYSKEPSPGGNRRPAIIRFVNQTSDVAVVGWIDFQGNEHPEKGGSIRAGEEMSLETYEGHRYYVESGKNRVFVAAAGNPGKVVINDRNVSDAGGEGPG